MSGFEPLENLCSAKATRALLLLSIFLFSASPGLAAGVLPTIVNHPAPTIEFNHPPPTTAGKPTIEFNHQFNHPLPTTAGKPTIEFNHPAPTTAGEPTTRIDELIKQYSKDPAATKERNIDRELQSQDKDQDSFRHEVTIDAGIPDNQNNTNKNNNCKNNSDHDIEFTPNGTNSDASACKCTNSDDSACKNSRSRF